jgi:biopolymer transport protein ExbD
MTAHLYKPRPERWPQFTLRGLLIFLAIVALLMPWAAPGFRAWLARLVGNTAEASLVLEVTENNKVLYAPESEITLEQLTRNLALERRVLEASGESPADVRVIIRADAKARATVVADVIRRCEDNGFKKFVLRKR